MSEGIGNLDDFLTTSAQDFLYIVIYIYFLNLKLFKKYHCVGYCVGPLFAVTYAPRAGSGQGPGGARGTPGSTLFPSTFLGEGWELSFALAMEFCSDP